MSLLSKLQPVVVEKPSEVVFKQLKDAILKEDVKTGDLLPSERKLSEQFGLNRVHVREALMKLEFYGLVEVRKQHGAIVKNTGVRATESIFSDALAMSKKDIACLMETREVIEVRIAELAALNGTPEELKELETRHQEFVDAVGSGMDAHEEDLRFHLYLADMAKNPVMRVLVGLMAPEVVELARQNNTCSKTRKEGALREHTEIFEAVVSGDGERAARAMRTHCEEGRKGHLSSARLSD
ncbi:FadR family transcriptional regulator [Rhodobacteraceae bacterium RKSG542]|uniref:FadR/GntR family transcriptional regulator n=1 Tax=Pseudovibrio flavus TaxID=2529854 RepID=UPI0012BCCE39|nr:FadR/GntR family transcriptional regulator [Pseudovibrio flavus]MTI18180.1 FadR family transcriptional regulator [Pseudovibrio flavus]